LDFEDGLVRNAFLLWNAFILTIHDFAITNQSKGGYSKKTKTQQSTKMRFGWCNCQRCDHSNIYWLSFSVKFQFQFQQLIVVDFNTWY